MRHSDHHQTLERPLTTSTQDSFTRGSRLLLYQQPSQDVYDPLKGLLKKTKQKVYVCCWIHLASGLFFIFGKVKLLAVADSLNRCSCLREQRNEGRWRWMIFTSTHAEYYSVPHSFVATKKLICSAIYFSLQLLPLIEKMLDFWRQQCCISSSTVSYLQSD